MNSTTKEVIIIICSILLFVGGLYAINDVDIVSNLSNFSVVFAEAMGFIALFILASMFTAYLVVVAKIKFLIRFIAIPLWLMFTLSTLVTIDQFLGYPYPTVPPKSEPIAYRIFFDYDLKQKMIESWMYFPETDKTRAYKFLWTEEREEKLKEAGEKAENGVRVEVELNSQPIDRPFGPAKDGHVDHKIEHRGLPPKEEVERR